MNSQEIKMLAQLERDMDSGNQPYVICNNQRLAQTQEILGQCGLVSGQTISSEIMVDLIKRNIASCQDKIAVKEEQARLH